MISKDLLVRIILVLLLILIVILAICIFIKISSIISRLKFLKKYGINELPKSIRVKRAKREEHNFFVLEYPFWEVSKKDGTADLRVTYNSICWVVSKLHVDTSLLISDRPYDILNVVKELRLRNVDIELCEEEKRKYVNLLNEKKFYARNYSIQNIIDYYKNCPSDFEKLCANLYNKIGYISKVTARTNDGGYDIIISDGKISSIVECKCYSLDNKVGRPAIQKLVGANNVVGADRLIFITTSTFSNPAISYAKEVGVELINGDSLLNLLNKYMFVKQQDVYVDMKECQLEIEDMRPYVPSDIFDDYFVV